MQVAVELETIDRDPYTQIGSNCRFIGVGSSPSSGGGVVLFCSVRRMNYTRGGTNQLGHIIGDHMKSLRLQYVARIRITQATRYAIALPNAMWAKQDLQMRDKR